MTICTRCGEIKVLIVTTKIKMSDSSIHAVVNTNSTTHSITNLQNQVEQQARTNGVIQRYIDDIFQINQTQNRVPTDVRRPIVPYRFGQNWWRIYYQPANPQCPY